jgi:hypothetical protein
VITDTKKGYQAESKPAIMPNGDIVVLYGTRKISADEGGGADSSVSTYTPLRFSSDGTIAYRAGAQLTQKGSCNGSEWLPDAVDGSSGPYHGRLYVVYGDNSYGACHVLISWSDNGGTNWSTPVIVDDTRPTLGYVDLEPSVVVNSKGVVGVAWLNPETDNATRYVPRFAYSTDGGFTFSSSVPTTTQSGSLDPLFGPFRTVGSTTMPEHGATYGRPPFIGDGPAGSIIMDAWVGLDMTATADGSFFVVHIDNRHHHNEIWSQQIVVHASASRFGSAMLHGLDDVSQDFFVSCLTPHLSTDATRFQCRLALVNLSTRARPAPKYFRFIYLRSYLGYITVANSVNGIDGPGALFATPSPLINTMFKPGETKIIGDFSFNIQKWPSSYIEKEKEDAYGNFATGLLDFDVQVLR